MQLLLLIFALYAWRFCECLEVRYIGFNFIVIINFVPYMYPSFFSALNNSSLDIRLYYKYQCRFIDRSFAGFGTSLAIVIKKLINK